jgi:hypothetical protein
MVRLALAAALVALVATDGLSARDPQDVQALKQQVKTLRDQKSAAIKAIHAQYDSVIKQTKLSEAERATARKTLAQQEKDIEALGTSTPESKATLEHMQTLRKAMLGEIVLDSKQIAELRAQRTTHIKNVTAMYDAKIKAVEAAIKAAPKTSTKTKTK